jgi:hypothetical protein
MSDFSSRCCLLYSDGFLKKTASANIYSARSLEDVYEVHDFQWPSTLEEARNTSKIGLELSEIQLYMSNCRAKGHSKGGPQRPDESTNLKIKAYQEYLELPYLEDSIGSIYTYSM